MSFLRMLGWASVFSLVIGSATPSFGESPTTKTPPRASKTKVFRLQHCDPNEASALLDNLLGSVPTDGVAPSLNPSPNGGFGGQVVPSPYSTAQDARTRAIIVRGNEKHLQLASDFVTVIDVPKGKPTPEVKTLRAVPLKHAEPLTLAQTIEELNYEAKIIAMPAAKMILFTGSDEVMKEISELIEKLDVETPPQPKPGDLRPLVNEPTDPKKGM